MLQHQHPFCNTASFQLLPHLMRIRLDRLTSHAAKTHFALECNTLNAQPVSDSERLKLFDNKRPHATKGGCD